MKAICILNNSKGENKGLVKMIWNGQGVYFSVKLWEMPPGKHGFHVHRTGNISNGPHTLCDHFTSRGKSHGDLNDPDAHNGDLGNLEVGENGECSVQFRALYISLSGANSIIGRSLVVHADRDDLGKGSFPDSATTGHSGERLLYGIIGIDEGCQHQNVVTSEREPIPAFGELPGGPGGCHIL